MTTRYTPFEDVDRMFEQMRRSLWGMANDPEFGMRPFGGRDVHVDLTEHDDELLLIADLPGFETEELELSVDDDTLTLSAEHESGADEVARSRHVTERVTLPRDVVDEEITATYRNGVLEVHLPIEEAPSDRGHAIDIQG